VRGDFRKIQTPVPFPGFIKVGKSDSTVGLRMPIQLRNAGSNAANPRRVCRRHEACRDDTRLNPIKAARDALAYARCFLRVFSGSQLFGRQAKFFGTQAIAF